MREHVRLFIKKCPCSQKINRLRVHIHNQPCTTATYSPFERVAIDTTGPLPPDEEGNTYLIVFIDCFLRLVSIVPAKDATGMSFAKAFIKYLKDRPNPSQIMTDNKPQFKNDLTSALTDLLGSEHVFKFAYSKQENGLVERVNKEVMRHMRTIIFDLRVRKHWGDYYPLVERIILTHKYIL